MGSIYIVDDDPGARESLCQLLSVFPIHEVKTFSSGIAFAESAAALPPGVVLLDHHMPKLTGLELLQMRQVHDRHVTIVITGMGNPAMAATAKQRGAFDFIEKPYPPGQLLDAIARAMARLDGDKADG